METWLKVLIVAASGGLGAVCRFFIEGALRTTGAWMGLATWLINTGGCFIIGLCGGFVLMSCQWNDTAKVAFTLATMTGFCGGFSTFSEFSLDSLKYFMHGEYMPFVIFVVLTMLAGLLFCALGFWLGTKL